MRRLFTTLVIASILLKFCTGSIIAERVWLPSIQSQCTEPTSTPTPTPNYSGVHVLSNYSYYTSTSDYLHIVGEVWNNTTEYIDYIKPSAMLFDRAGRLLDTAYDYCRINTLAPGDRTCFDIVFTNPPAEWSWYELEQVSYEIDAEVPPRLQVIQANGFLRSETRYEVVGQIRNDSGESVEYVKAIVTLYDAEGNVMGCDYDYVNSSGLEHGQCSAFKTEHYGRDWTGVASFRVQADGRVE